MKTYRPASLQAVYVKIMTIIVGNALSALSRIDKVAREEIKKIPANYHIEMITSPQGANFKLKVTDTGLFELVRNQSRKADLVIRFKHTSHAFLVFSFQEGTALAFARDRMVAEGDLNYATKFVRILNRLEALILPEFIARKAVKRYPPELGIKEKITKAAQIYARTTTTIILGRSV
ncbi:SCP2 sterol-binding domain-containing protein [Endozoicomonas lisbonensis]|uniref:SCP2 domain-containing protein n=1 Tax=Endozoicomonas lisbonensis TaxID=3120522 RepID=A0ABV2SKG4_9GAMM